MELIQILPILVMILSNAYAILKIIKGKNVETFFFNAIMEKLSHVQQFEIGATVARLARKLGKALNKFFESGEIKGTDLNKLAAFEQILDSI